MRWDAAVIDDEIARAILDEFYALPDTLPDTLADGFEGVYRRFAQQGLQFTAAAADTSWPAPGAAVSGGSPNPRAMPGAS